MAAAVAGETDDPEQWNWIRGLSLFWDGVLVNDQDGPKAATILQTAVGAMEPVVQAHPDDVEKRFRYAEALRWSAVTQPSSAQTASTEHLAIQEYKTIWDDHGVLDSSLLSRVGVGYGFALANLARTVRENQLVNLDDGRTAAGHASWVLEILALAKEKDDLDQEMISLTPGSADAAFVGGWYRMSSYGWALGFLGGLVRLEQGGINATECDTLAADPYDPQRRAAGLTLDKVNKADAEKACTAEHQSEPNDALTTYQLSRVISADANRTAEYLTLAREAASEGNSAAFAEVAYELSQKKDDRSGDAYVAATQRTLIDTFPVLYPFLVGHATTDRERGGLEWYAERAAELGVPEAQLALVDLVADPVEKLFHAKLAAELFTQAGNSSMAAEALLKAGEITANQADQSVADAKVTAWKPEALVNLPAENGAS